MTKSWTLEVKEDPETKDLILEFPEDFLKETGWKEGDALDWIDRNDGSWELKKKPETEWVLVECVSSFRQRYMVEVPKGKSEWALDTVTMEEAKEFSQEHIGEQIISHRIISKEDALELCDVDNAYTKAWDEETKMKNFFTTWKEQNGNAD